MAGNPNFDSLLSTTLDKYIPTLVDNVFSSQPALWVIKNEGRIVNQEGGVTAVVPLLYAESKNHGSYSGSDTFSTEDDDNITAAQYPWRQYESAAPDGNVGVEKLALIQGKPFAGHPDQAKGRSVWTYGLDEGHAECMVRWRIVDRWDHRDTSEHTLWQNVSSCSNGGAHERQRRRGALCSLHEFSLQRILRQEGESADVFGGVCKILSGFGGFAEVGALPGWQEGAAGAALHGTLSKHFGVERQEHLRQGELYSEGRHALSQRAVQRVQEPLAGATTERARPNVVGVSDSLNKAETSWSAAVLHRNVFDYGLIKIVGLEEAQNSGSRTRVLDLIKARVKAVEMTISENLDQMFFGDGSGNGGKDFLGLKAIVSAGNPPGGPLGGIDATAVGNEWWRSTVDTTNENWSTWGFTGMSRMWLAVSEGADHPTHLFTTADLLATIEGSLTQNARYMDPETADAGFQNLLWKGVPIVYDQNVDAGYLYMININYISLYTLAGVWFQPSELLTPVNQDVKYKSIKCYGQFVTDNRKRHGLHTNLTAA